MRTLPLLLLLSCTQSDKPPDTDATGGTGATAGTGATGDTAPLPQDTAPPFIDTNAQPDDTAIPPFGLGPPRAYLQSSIYNAPEWPMTSPGPT